MGIRENTYEQNKEIALALNGMEITFYETDLCGNTLIWDCIVISDGKTLVLKPYETSEEIRAKAAANNIDIDTSWVLPPEDPKFCHLQTDIFDWNDPDYRTDWEDVLKTKVLKYKVNPWAGNAVCPF